MLREQKTRLACRRALTRGGRSLAAAALSLLLAGPHVRAQDGPPTAEALASARSLRVLALEAFELRHYEQAADLLRRALAAESKPLDGELRAEAAALLVRAEAVLSPVALVLDRATPATLRVQAAPQASAPGPAARLPAAPSPTAAPIQRHWRWAAAVVVTCAAAIALGFGLTGRSTESRAAVSALPVATRGGP